MSIFRRGLVTLAIVMIARVASAQTSSVTGRVTNSQGGPVPDADVTLRVSAPAMPGMPMPANEPAPRTARTGPDGSFTVANVPAGAYILYIDAEGFGRSSQEITVPVAQPFAVTLEPLEIPGAPVTAEAAGTPDTTELLEQIKTLEQRIAALESSTVLSDPITRVKRIEIWVDENGVQYDHEVPGSKRKETYERERVYRRENINEKIEEALADAEEHNVKIGVSAATVVQASHRTEGDETTAEGHAYGLANADLFFTAGLAQHTVFFADIVGLSGSVPDNEIPSVTLLNSFTARLVRQNELNLREAWVRTELFSQRLSFEAGRVDLTNTFDHNAAANDETTQFISDGLVNNPALGLAVNGFGALAVLDPKNGFNFKLGFQQSNTDATNLSQSLYTLTEAGYVARPPGLNEGNYRAWFRWNNSTTAKKGWGVSLDQKIIPTLTLFGRYGSSETDVANDDDIFYSAGFQVQNGWVFNPLDTWGVGYAHSDLASGVSEDLAEAYYNFRLTERLRLSFHLQRVADKGGDASPFGYVLPGVRLQANF